MMRFLPVVTISTALVASLGCAETDASDSAIPDLVQTSERLAEVEIGEFRIPLAAVDVRRSEEPSLSERNSLLLRFRLYAIVPPRQEGHVTARMQSHRARLREEVIRTCRKATLEELDEPALLTLKGELHKVLARYFGPKHLRQIVMTNVLLEPT